MEFVTDYDLRPWDTLFDAFDVDTFYEEIKTSSEYQCEAVRLRLNKLNLLGRATRLTKLQPGITIIQRGKIICRNGKDLTVRPIKRHIINTTRFDDY